MWLDGCPPFADETIYKSKTSPCMQRMQIALSEFLGTALLIFISCTGCSFGIVEGTVSPLQLSLTSGLAVMTIIQIFAHISGAHVNPAVTLCSVIMGETSLITSPIYIGSQIVGSLTGYAIVMAVTPLHRLNVGNGLCVNMPHQEITVFQALIVEFIATTIMCLAICSSWDRRNSHRTDSVALRIGFLVAVLNMAVGTYTGCSMNPTRSVGPAVWNNNLRHHWIYWVGPITGGIFSGLFYSRIYLKPLKLLP